MNAFGMALPKEWYHGGTTEDSSMSHVETSLVGGAVGAITGGGISIGILYRQFREQKRQAKIAVYASFLAALDDVTWCYDRIAIRGFQKDPQNLREYLRDATNEAMEVVNRLNTKHHELMFVAPNSVQLKMIETLKALKLSERLERHADRLASVSTLSEARRLVAEFGFANDQPIRLLGQTMRIDTGTWDDRSSGFDILNLMAGRRQE
jgi:hypothetical protein